MKKRKISFAHQISLFSLSVILLFLIAAISYQQIKALNESEQLVNHSKDIHIELEQLMSTLETIATTQRGFLLTGDSSYMVPFDHAQEKMQKNMESLKVLIKSDIQQSKNLDTLSDVISERFYYFGKEIHIKAENPTFIFTRPQLQEGTKAMNKIRSLVTRMINIEKGLLKIRQKRHQYDVKITPLTTFLSILFSLLIFLFSFYKIDNDRKYLRKINNQLLITKQTFEHAEQIAEISNWSWKIEENVMTYSNNQYRLLGCEPNEFEPTMESFAKFVHPDDREIVAEGTRRVLEESSSSASYFRVIRKDGVLRHFKSIGKIISDNYGKKILIGINADITDQYFKDKMLEEKLYDFETSNKELSAFNHIASHDLQEPLRKIQTFISRIIEQDSETLSQKAKEYFGRIQVAAARMQNLIGDLLMFSRTYKSDKLFELTDLNEILFNSKQELQQAIEDKNGNIESSSLPTINIIPFQIQQLFINIIGNALKYSKPNIAPVIKIKASIVSGREVQGAFSERDFYKISISDNGIGFEQKYAESIFTLFYRLHDDVAYYGTGIGLAICKKIVENHKGFINAEGIPNIGSTFNIYLPTNN
jgi:PAS domain S-box-containing protein